MVSLSIRHGPSDETLIIKTAFQTWNHVLVFPDRDSLGKNRLENRVEISDTDCYSMQCCFALVERLPISANVHLWIHGWSGLLGPGPASQIRTAVQSGWQFFYKLRT